MAESLWIAILKNLCHHREKFLIIVGLLGVLLLFSLIGTVVITPGTASYAVNAFNVVGLSVFLVLGLVLVFVCFTTDLRYE